jgi:tetratricopeptide (TPR) repeat protein
MKRSYRATLLAILTLASGSARACLNDRDTLANEANRMPDVLRAITGRFERNPPLYYQMRIDHVAAELKADPTKLSDYDDIAVANGRIGQDDAAIDWIDRKKLQLLKLNASDPAVKDQWYSYYANIGTFYIHRWARAGADRSHIGEVDTARGYIQKAIDINPDAHFGREKYQLMVMNWICDRDDETLGRYLRDAGVSTAADRKAAITGLSGLVVLGGAWESVDVFDALAELLDREFWSSSRLAYFAELRCDELIDSGHRSMMTGGFIGGDLKQELAAYTHVRPDPDDLHMFRVLRAEADRWQKARTDFMMARLIQGRHPDTDQRFWSGYHETPPPHIANPWDEAIYLAIGAPLGIEFHIFWLMVVIVMAMLSVVVVHRVRSRWAQRWVRRAG